jgi:NADP-dependent 3-hydroxy acid dehydrogenase YdfG
MENKVWMITGCSSGFGKAIAAAAINAGYAVAVTARDVNSLAEFEALKNELVWVTELDVVSQDSVSAAVEKTIARFGRIDVLVNNAGYGYYEIFEELEIEELKKEMDVNLYGVLRTCQAVLPQMRKQRSGHIINISSIGGWWFNGDCGKKRLQREQIRLERNVGMHGEGGQPLRH